MIKKLQRRFIFITMTCMGLIFILILMVLNISMSVSSRRLSYGILSEYAQRKTSPGLSPDHEGSHFPADSPAFPFNRRRHDWFNDMRIAYACYDTEKNVLEISVGGNPDLTDDTLKNITDRLLEKTKEQGSVSGYLYLKTQNDKGTQIYLLDYSPEKEMSARLLWNCMWIGLAGIMIIFIPVIFLSRWVSKPVQSAFDKQKQFIADASHELKTPLTIITTNAEVLESSMPGNKWISHILEQSSRMKLLINNLLELAKLDSYSDNLQFITFDLSKTVKNAALSFESLAYEYNKTFKTEIENNLTLYGSENNIRQLVTILLDNAFKYSDEGGTILIRLSSHGDKKKLLVQNTGKGIPVSDQKHVFERFYRSDFSRSRESGGYGLGLAIAKSIVESHKGHISVKSDGETYTSFYVVFP